MSGSTQKHQKHQEHQESGTRLFVFGYGSLVHPESLAYTVLRSVAGEMAPREARLEGWVRDWNVGSDMALEGAGVMLTPEGEAFKGVVTWLGLRAEGAGTCNGAVLPVSEEEILLLDAREEEYDRVDVTAPTSWAGKQDGSVVYTYVPKASSVARHDEALEAGRAVVRAQYVELVEWAFGALSEEARVEYLATTPIPPCPLLPLTINNDI